MDLYHKCNSFGSIMYRFKEVTQMEMQFLSLRIINYWL